MAKAKKIRATLPSAGRGIITLVTMEDLKENRIEIIEHITSMAGASFVKEVMAKMVANLGKETCHIKLADSLMCEMGLFRNASRELSEYNREMGKRYMIL
jgi:hypothetical protein